MKLIPIVDALDFPREVEMELEDHDISTHDEVHILYLDWNRFNYPKFQNWLISESEIDIKEYSQVVIDPT